MKKSTVIILTSFCAIEIMGLMVWTLILPLFVLPHFAEIYHSFGVESGAFSFLTKIAPFLWLLPIIDVGLLIITALAKKMLWFVLLILFVFLQCLLILALLYSGIFSVGM